MTLLKEVKAAHIGELKEQGLPMPDPCKRRPFYLMWFMNVKRSGRRR